MKFEKLTDGNDECRRAVNDFRFGVKKHCHNILYSKVYEYMFLKGYPSEAKIAPKEMRVSNLNRRKLVQSAYTPSSQAKGTKSTSFLAYGTKWTYCPASQE